MEDVLQTIEEENAERIEKDKKKYRVDIRELKAVKGEEGTLELRSWYFDGLYFRKKFHKAIITMYSENKTLGRTEGGLDIHSPVFIKIFVLEDIIEDEVTVEGFTREQEEIIQENRKKPKANKGQPKTTEHRKSINELAAMLEVSNRRIMAYCKRMRI